MWNGSQAVPMRKQTILVVLWTSMTAWWTQCSWMHYACMGTTYRGLFCIILYTQLPRFFSRYWNPGSEAIDAFTVSWGGERCWWAPPPHLVVKVLRHAQACRSIGTLVVSVWASAPFWRPSGSSFADFVHVGEIP